MKKEQNFGVTIVIINPQEEKQMKSKEEIYLEMAEVAAQKSKCPRNQFSALLVDKHGRVKGHGYNGTVTGYSNLCGGKDCLRDRQKIESGTHPDVGCVHAEQNLVINCNREDLVGGTVYVNGECCSHCAKLLAQAQIKRVVFRSGGYSTNEGVQFLRQHGVVCTRLDREENETDAHNEEG